MINNRAELRLVIEQLAGLSRALSSLHADIAPRNYANYQMLAEGPIDYILQFRRDIDAYLGIGDERVATQKVRPLRDEAELAQATEQLGRLYLQLADLRERLHSTKPEQWEQAAAASIHEICRLRSAIDAHFGIPTEVAAEQEVL